MIRTLSIVIQQIVWRITSQDQLIMKTFVEEALDKRLVQGPVDSSRISPGSSPGCRREGRLVQELGESSKISLGSSPGCRGERRMVQEPGERSRNSPGSSPGCRGVQELREWRCKVPV